MTKLKCFPDKLFVETFLNKFCRYSKNFSSKVRPRRQIKKVKLKN